MKNLSFFIWVSFFTLLFASPFNTQAQIGPPENLYVTPVGLATWDSIQNDDFQFYKLFLDGVYITDVDSISYQYGSNGESLESGETYLAEIAALYNDGLSEKVGFEFVYLPCDSFPPHSGFDGYIENNELYFIWNQVEEELDQIYMGTNFYFENEFVDFIPAPDTFLIFPNPGPGFYDYCFKRVYSYDNGIHNWEACEGENCIQAGYPPELDPPRELEVVDNTWFQNPTICWLEWKEPGWFNPVWLQYDDGVNVDGIGLSSGGEMDVAIKWDPDQLEGFEGTAISKIKFFAGDYPGVSWTLRVYQGDNGIVIYEQALTSNEITFGAWNEIVLDTPVEIDITQSIWVGYLVVHVGGESPAGVANAAPSSNSDLVRFDGGAWDNLQNYLPYSWNLAAYVEGSKGLSKIKSNDLLGYLVYRWGEAITDTIQELSYIDTIPEYNYPACYEVSAVYEMGISDPSNMACATILPSSSISTKQPICIYPNPAQTNCKITSTDLISSVLIYNQMGQQVFIIDNLNSNELQLDLTPFENGIYFIEIKNNEKTQKSKLIIQR